MACGNSRQECLQTGLWKQPGSVPLGEGRFCSEAPQARGRTQHSPYPWPAWPRPSWPPVVLPQEGVGCRGYVQICPGPIKAQPPKVFPLGLGLS